jgi:hypothetical protein
LVFSYFFFVGAGRNTKKAARGKGSSTSRATGDKTKKQKTASSGAKGSGSALLDQVLRECDPGEVGEGEEPPEPPKRTLAILIVRWLKSLPTLKKVATWFHGKGMQNRMQLKSPQHTWSMPKSG